VSEKDFRLPIERQQLTEELAPIHDRLTHSLEALKHAFEREKEAVADISHELRTPVASLLATIDVSLRKPRTAEQYKQTLEDCRDITKQLGGLVERVMTLAYLDAGQTAVTKATTDVADVADGCASVIRPLAESHGLTLTTEVSEPVELSTDADKLREVILNLLHNAVEYNQPGGQVRLCVRSEPNAKRVVVEVSDTGIGMTPDVKGKIFERFYRADPSRTATGVHAGLGLAIVKEYVSRLGGRISVDSEPGQGSTFRITLPA
jgi:signal transduction histidine kinase